MRRTVIAFASTVSAVVLLFSYRTSTGSAVTTVAGTGVHSGTTATAPVTGTAAAPPAGTTAAAGRTVTGSVVDTRFGPVQVQITVSGTTIAAATALQYPDGDNRSARINQAAVPVLEQETISAQSAAINAVSGASYTSQGYVQSLQSALDQVHA